MAKQPTGSSWRDHILLLSAVSEAVGGADDMLLESVIKYVHPEFKQALMARVDTNRFDSKRQAGELCRFVQLMESKHAKLQGTAKCYNCGKIGHFKGNCVKMGATNTDDIVLEIGNRESEPQILKQIMDFGQRFQQASRNGCEDV
uniref:AlNc14C584G12215 protein n=1 Tax=Albugo laibachii Nc14 TaxID=890382 RepID=F0X1C4_9STRA|nr:AlNc14C584G12215 [Albugo laibachii Nc14]|eukprot:CCA27600.1 AlNc14C584G12215 [Albugo laibachii Nc14]